MSEENQNSEDFIKGILQETKKAEFHGGERRVSTILAQARRRTGTRDFITLIFVRFWIILTEIICKIIARHSINQEINPTNFNVKHDKKVNPKE